MNKGRIKAVLASALVSLALAGPAMVFSAPATVAEIHIQGAELRHVMVGGTSTVQAIFSVSIDKTANATGASFFLEYNPDYLVPSNITTNASLDNTPAGYRNDYFAADPELYYVEDSAGKKTPISPFDNEDGEMGYLDTARNLIHMELWLDRDSTDDTGDLGIISQTGGPSGTDLGGGNKIGGKIGLLERVGYEGDTTGSKTAYVVNYREDQEDLEDHPAGEVTLGYLSFQVNSEHLAEMLYYFDSMDKSRDHQYAPNPADPSYNRPWVYTKNIAGTNGPATFLLDMTEQYSEEEDPWTVGHFYFTSRGPKYFETLKPDYDTTATTTMVDHYTFKFNKKLIVDVEATEPEVVVNAYQNFTHGDMDDLPLTMGRYSPTVTVTYADGSKENVPFPWGLKDGTGAYKDSYTVKQATTFYTQVEVDAWVAANVGKTADDCPFDVGDPIPDGSGNVYAQGDVDAWIQENVKTAADCPFSAGQVKPTSAFVNTTPTNYDPTRGVYLFSQKYTWTDANGTHTFDKPVTAKLTVTPITVIDVVAEDMERSYKLDDVVSLVPDANALDFPDEARIVTDVVPAGVSLTTPIKGWKPVRPATVPLTDPDGTPNSGDEYYKEVSKWPGVDPSYPAGELMHSLKADTYVPEGTYATGDPLKATEGFPHWPDANDVTSNAITDKPAQFLGRYSFETSQADHDTRENILSSDIKRAYPWLTIPFKPGSTTDRVEDWDVGKAHRTILDEAGYNKVNTRQYEVIWRSTVTEPLGNGKPTPGTNSHPNGQGQPTLTLAVYKKTGANFNGYGAMADDSIFRVWLPNGQEIGTGQDAGGVKVDSWFTSSLDTDPLTKNDHVNGYYNTKADYRAGSGSAGQFFNLITNPDQPEINEHGTERETLRRYINLGGWYQVAVCENPNEGTCGAHNDGGGTACAGTTAKLVAGKYRCDTCGEDVSGANPVSAAVWSAPMPVYVPPRRNEYVESKIYNFIGANTDLYNWPGGVEDTLYMPRGSYEVVGPLGTPLTAGVGLPLYTATTGDVTDGTALASPAIFESGNIFRVLPGVARYQESYGVKTIYDGQTGAQPGEVFSIRVKQAKPADKASWGLVGGNYLGEQTDPLLGLPQRDVYRYGPTPLYEGIDQDGDGVIDGYAVAGFGRVFQPEDDAATPGVDESDTYTATLRREGTEKAAESVRIKLLSDIDEGITRVVPNSTPGYRNENVTLVTYDTKQVGYTVRQDFTLTIKNVGTTDIYGLDIDSVTDEYNLKDDGVDGTRMMGGHFEMLKPPASFLPVGATTTFTLTYVYDLPANVEPNTLLYRDTLYITANGHNDPGKGHTHDTGSVTDQYLLDFDAEFVVSNSPLHKVTVIYRPTNGNMGTANLIVGEQGTPPEIVYTPTTRTYAKDGMVYVVVNMVDEYAIKDIYITDSAGNPIKDPNDSTKDLAPLAYSGTATTDPERLVYVFQMPDQDVTVYVDFYEPFHSKLRLEDLIDFSSPPDPDGAPGTVNDLRTAPTSVFASQPPKEEHQYKVWRKTFTDAEKTAAVNWEAATAAGETDYYLMTQGSARPHGADWPTVTDGADEGQQFIPKENHYLVVIDPDADISQVEAKIRRVIYHEDYMGVTALTDPNGYNYEIELDISMAVYPYNVEKKNETTGNYNWNTPGYRSEPIYTPNTTSGQAALGYGPSPAFTGIPRRENSTTGTIVGGPPNYAPPDYSTGLSTSDSSIHTSVQFPSPKKGESSYVVLTLEAYNPEIGATDSRSYYLEIHRRTDEPNVELHYGNSPYGMIMNEDRNNTKQKQDDAKAAFRNAGYTFQGLSKEFVPDAVWDHADMHYVTYNREAWARNRAVFEPESLTGFIPARHPDNSQQFYDEPSSAPTASGAVSPSPSASAAPSALASAAPGASTPPAAPSSSAAPGRGTKPIYVPDKKVYVDEENLDLNDYAYFAILGEKLREPGVIRAWDSSGRPVDINLITAVAMDVDWETNGKGLTLLDVTQTKQVARFKGNTADFPVLDLGIQGSTFEFAGEHPPATPSPVPGATPSPTPTPAPTLAPGASPAPSPSPTPKPWAPTAQQWPASSREVTVTPTDGTDPYTETEYTLIENIRPGRYAIVYSFTDFDGTTVIHVDRPFVILRKVGDVNSDGVRDNVKGAVAAGKTGAGTDEYHLEDRVGIDPLGFEAGLAPNATEPHGGGYPFANIFKFRVCDVNNDRNVNHIDANLLDKNARRDKFAPGNLGWLRFYHPWEYGL